MSLNAPASTVFRPQPRPPVAVAPSISEVDDDAPAAVVAAASEEAKQQHEQQEEDEEVKIAMEMALAAAQNPHMSVAELRRMVVSSSVNQKQVEIVDTIQQKKEQQQQEEKQKYWNEQRNSLVGWVHTKAGTVASTLERKAEEIQDAYERRLYAEEIQNDAECKEIKKKIKFMTKTLKANRLQGNRVETKHAFKRQRDEKRMLNFYDKVDKQQRLFISSSYNVHEYARAMMRASKKWNKIGNDQELALEAQLCRNMHQMLTIEKQKAKVNKSSKEMKKYLQRCKSWLSDKKALCEMHIMTIDATNNSMVSLYQETIRNQDNLIKRLTASDEFSGVDLESVELRSWKELSLLQQEHDTNSTLFVGPSATMATLAALRGLPINDSIRLRRTTFDKYDEPNMKPPPPGVTAADVAGDPRKQPPQHHHNHRVGCPQTPELFIETKDDGSVSSHLSDPDDEGEAFENYSHNQKPASSSDSDSGVDRFGSDAPWLHTGGGGSSIDEEEGFLPTRRAAVGIIDGPAGNTMTTATTTTMAQPQSSTVPSRSSGERAKRRSRSPHASSSKPDQDRKPAAKAVENGVGNVQSVSVRDETKSIDGKGESATGNGVVSQASVTGSSMKSYSTTHSSQSDYSVPLVGGEFVGEENRGKGVGEESLYLSDIFSPTEQTSGE